MITCEPVHNHTLSACTLPDDPADGFGYSRDRCYWSETAQVWYREGNACGCPTCTDQYARRQERRRDRHRARLDLARFDPQDW